jgi:ABC-type antimicrobial peptide transport system permease subunit
LDPDLPLVETVFTERLHASLADPRRWTSVLAAFAGTALALAALGIFGLMSYIVRQRRREIGVRLALGAEPAAVTRMIVGRGMRYALAGTAVGFGLSLLEARWLRSLLYGIGPLDPLTLVGSVGVLLFAALCASLLPGWRASRIRPIEAMQAE